MKNPPFTVNKRLAGTTPDISALVAALQHFHPLADETIEFLKKNCIPCVAPKGTLILEAGNVCEYLYFILKGAVRGFIRDGNRDVTTWITAEYEMVTSIYSLDLEIPAIENMEAVEDCHMLAISNTTMQELYMRFPEANIVGRKLLQQYYRDAEGRAYIVRLSSAESKYRYFLQTYPKLVNRIPLKHIASFLGITLETLSRVRGKMTNG